MASATPTTSKRRQPAAASDDSNGEQSKIEEHNEQAVTVVKDGDDKETDDQRKAREHQEALDALEYQGDGKRWVIGKPPEHGGNEQSYSVYYQQPLGWMPRSRFFSVVSAAVSKAIRASGGSVGGLADVFGNDGGSLRQRAANLSERDFKDASSFFALAMELVAYTPDLLLECYCIWLQVPVGQREWAKLVFEQPWDPEHDRWGLKDDQHELLIETFIDQNYEELRRFFTETVRKLALRVEKNEKARVSASAQ